MAMRCETMILQGRCTKRKNAHRCVGCLLYPGKASAYTYVKKGTVREAAR